MRQFFQSQAWIAAACLCALLAACFGPIALDSRQLAYRDFSDFYYPLYQKVQQEWEQGRLPVWSSGENCGSPLLGNPTAAVLYPGKLIYACLPYPRAAKVYVVFHVVLAFAAMVVLCRGWGVSTAGSSLAGLAFAFGAPVLTQYSNVVFLVGAAWMPLGFRFADDWLRSGRLRGIAGLALVLAMQVLGGDPEAAYLTAFAATAFGLGLAISRNPERRPLRIGLTVAALAATYGILLGFEFAGISTSYASLGIWVVIGLAVLSRRASTADHWSVKRRLFGLAAACTLAVALSGVQLVTSLEFIAQSNRADSEGSVDPYNHSIHPARLVEWVWPNAFGATFGFNRNWLTALPPTNDKNVWMNSIYLGGFTILFGSAAVGLRNENPARRWMIGVALVGILGGLGDHASPIFLARSLQVDESRFGKLELSDPPLPREDGLLRDGDGGVYWFLSTALPGFRSFRFPGKLFIAGSLGLAALAGFGFDRLLVGRRRFATALGGLMLGASLAGLAFVVVRGEWILAILKARAPWAMSAFGPFDAAGARVDLRQALIHGSVVATGFLVLTRIAPRRPGLAAVLALGGLSVDLAIANHGQLGVVAQSAYEGDPRTLEAIRRSEQEEPQPGPYRVFRLPSWALMRYGETGSDARLEEIVRWERDTLRPKYELPLGVESPFAYSTAELAEIRQFFEPFRVVPDEAVARRLGVAPGLPVVYYPRHAFDLWNTRYFIVPTRLAWNSTSRGFASLLPETTPIYPPRFEGPDAKARREQWGTNEDVQVLKNRAAFPRAWVIHRVIPIRATSRMKASERLDLMKQILYQEDELWRIDGMEVNDDRKVARVEATIDQLGGLAGGRGGDEPVKVVDTNDPARVVLEANLASPGLVILADVYYPGWTLEVDGRPTEILRTNRAMRGAIVAAGNHRLVYTYRPFSLRIGCVLSAVGLAAWVILLAFAKRVDRRHGSR